MKDARHTYFLLFNLLLFISIDCLASSSHITHLLQTKAVTYKTIPFKKNGIFKSEDRHIGYDLRIKNEVDDNQRGTINVEVKNAAGYPLFHSTVGVYIPIRGTFGQEINFDNTQFAPGFYTVTMILSTNHISSDTTYYVFALEPEKLQPIVNKPSDFDAFWNDTKRELVNTNPNFNVIKRPDLSTIYVDVYLVEFKSLDDITVRGWLSVPKDKGKFPVIYKLPDYLVDMQPEMRRDIAVFSLNVRGHGNSNDEVKLDYKQYNTANIFDKYKYIYRGVYMDCLRGLEFIYYKGTELKLDTSKISITGEGQGAALAAATASLDASGRRAKGIAIENPIYTDWRNLIAYAELQREASWPAAAFKDYIYNNRTKFFNTWDYFDPINFAANINCPVLLAIGLKNTNAPPQCSYDFFNQLRFVKRELYSCPNCSEQLDANYLNLKNIWTKEVLRAP
jgi:cephalosporin-C deacetylase